MLAADASIPATPRPVSRDEKQYRRLLEDYLGPVTAFLILLACLSMKIPNAETIAETLAMDEDEQALVIEPLARVLDRQKLPEKVKGTILNSGDLMGIVLGFGSYGLRVAAALQTLQRGESYAVNRGHAPGETGPTTGLNGHGSALAGLAQYAP